MPFILNNEKLELKTQGGSFFVNDFTKGRQMPFYLYDLDEVIRRAEKFQKSGCVVHYAMKANGNPRLLRELAKIGVGVDVVSLGELKRALQVGIDPSKIIFSGVGKTEEDFAVGIAAKIYQFNVESFEELRRLAKYCTEHKVSADVALRLNLDIFAPTHPYIQTGASENKFGIDATLLPEILPWLKGEPQLRLQGIAVHVGSQIMDLDVFRTVAQRTMEKVQELKALGWPMPRIDLGGGLGINYQESGVEDDIRIDQYLQILRQEIPSGFRVSLEPGRILVARAGVLMGRVLYVKKSSKKTFVILNTGSHHLLRPALYQAFHRIVPVVNEKRPEREYDFVGPLCESSDFLGLGRKSPEVFAGEWVAIMDAGAYGRVMASRYNEHELPAELCVRNGEVIEVNL